MFALVVKLLGSLISLVRWKVAVGRELWTRGGLAAATFVLNWHSVAITVELGALGENSPHGCTEICLALMLVARAACPSSAQVVLAQQLERKRVCLQCYSCRKDIRRM